MLDILWVKTAGKMSQTYAFRYYTQETTFLKVKTNVCGTCYSSIYILYLMSILRNTHTCTQTQKCNTNVRLVRGKMAKYLQFAFLSVIFTEVGEDGNNEYECCSINQAEL